MLVTPEAPEILALRLLDTCFHKEREAESHGHPVSAFQSQAKMAEILSASVALSLQEIAVVVRMKVGHLRIWEKKAQNGLKF